MWKEFFYFSKGQRIGIVVLIILILFAVGVNYLLPLVFKVKDEDGRKFLTEVDQFKKSLVSRDSMFTAIVATRTIFEVLLSFNWLKSLPMLRLIKNTKIDFIAKRRICYVISLTMIIIGLVVFFKKGKVW